MQPIRANVRRYNIVSTDDTRDAMKKHREYLNAKPAEKSNVAAFKKGGHVE